MRAVRMGVVVVTCFTLAAPAAAEDKAAARQAYAEGTKYYDLNQFAEALEAFKKAYWNYEDPVFLFNIAQCHRALGHKSDAVGFYRSYLRKTANAPNRVEVQKIIADLEKAIADEKKLSSAPPTGTITNESKASTPATTAPAVVEAAPPPKAEKPVWKRGWFWGVIAGVVVVGVVVGVGVGVGTQSHVPSPTDGTVRF